MFVAENQHTLGEVGYILLMGDQDNREALIVQILEDSHGFIVPVSGFRAR